MVGLGLYLEYTSYNQDLLMVITKKTTKVTQWHENQERKNKTRFTVVVNTVKYKRNVEKTEVGKKCHWF